MELATKSVVILIPAYNAATSLEELVDRLNRSVSGVRVVVVDDGSMDKTSEVANSVGAVVLKHEKNRGKGAALQTGFDFVKNFTDIQFIFTIDADLQHQPEDIPKFVSAQQQTNADLVIGWRERMGTGMPLHRIASNSLTSALVGIRTRRTIKDSQCGFRMIRHSFTRNIRLESTGYEAETEFLIKAAKLGCKIEFVPIQTVYGSEKSYMTNWATTKNFIKVLFRKYE
jgi:glycosyltransferase involved in cell wall biosynthesis